MCIYSIYAYTQNHDIHTHIHTHTSILFNYSCTKLKMTEYKEIQVQTVYTKSLRSLVQNGIDKMLKRNIHYIKLKFIKCCFSAGFFRKENYYAGPFFKTKQKDIQQIHRVKKGSIFILQNGDK